MNSYWQRGQLFIDVLLAAFILTTVLLAIGSGFTLSTRATHQAAEYTVAANLAQKQLEVLRGTKNEAYWNTTVPNTTTTAVIDWEMTTTAAGATQNERLSYALVNMTPSINGTDTNFTHQLTCNNRPYLVRTEARMAAEDTNLVQVTVTVSWQDRNQIQFIQATNFYRRVAL